MDGNQNNLFKQSLLESIKIAGPLATIGGIFADVINPLIPISIHLLAGSILLSLVLGVVWKKKDKNLKIKLQSSELTDDDYLSVFNSCKIRKGFSFSMMSVPVFLVSFLFTMSGGAKGKLGSTFKPVSSFQKKMEQLVSTTKETNEIAKEIKRDIASIKTHIQDVKEIKNVVTIEGYQHIQKLNELIPVDGSKVSIAVMNFNNNTNNKKHETLGFALSDMVINDLSKINAFKVVERSQIEKVMKELKLSNSKAFDSSTSQEIGKLLGATYLAIGSFFKFGNDMRFDLRIVKTETGEIYSSAGVTGKESSFFSLQKQLVWKLSKIFYKGIHKYNFKEVKTSYNNVIDSSVLYADSVKLYKSGEKVKAMKLMKKAIKKNPKFTVAVDRLEVWKGEVSL
ncbi:MAG: hypothetical protein KC493_18205 [Bacteriovoracaceae bacterium]|nr:hypothetical protein [Bacteriovoracaceae bacterium]